MAARFTLGAFAIILDEQRRVLLCHRRDGDLWNLPGGGVEAGETSWEAVVREVREETGLEVAVQRLHGVYVKPEQDDVVFSFVCTIRSGTPMLSEEADRIAWFAADGLPANTSPKQRARVVDALSQGDALVMATQFGPSSAELFGARRAATRWIGSTD